LYLLSFLILRPPPSPTLFPYTTLFRSSKLYFFIRLRQHILIIIHSTSHSVLQCSDVLAFIIIPQLALGIEFFSIFLEEFIIKHRSEEHTSELQSRENLVCRLLLEKKKK